MIAGPGAGKSSTAYFLAGHMKARGYKVEYVREFPKDLVWDGRNNDIHSMFTEQDFILANQNNLFRRLLAHDIEYVITDTSMLLGLVYLPQWFPNTFVPYLLDVHRSYNNITFYVDRGDLPYVEAGRNESRDEAKNKDHEAKHILDAHRIPYKMVQQKNGVYDKCALEMLTHIQDLEDWC